LPLYRRIGGKKRKKASRRAGSKKFQVSFTTADALSYILKAWVNDVIRLGAKPTLKSVVMSLWARYLQKMGVAFVGANQKCGVGIVPSFRDVQVGMFKRKRLLSAFSVARRKKWRSVATKKQQKQYEESDSPNLYFKQISRNFASLLRCQECNIPVCF
jgi:hypothetical protein